MSVPAYNGGLFDHDQHDFLTDHEVSNRYLAEVIYRLSTTQNDDGRYVLADYADLDTRHLGSVYEGLLEHHFRIAPEQYAAVAEDGGQVWKPADEVTVADAVETVPAGGLYVVNDEGERKATGAYYTPDYVVTYIVEETIGPLVEEIREDLVDQGYEPGTRAFLPRFVGAVTDLKILDPAMGSGHFLTRATEYLAREVMSEYREVEAEMDEAFDEESIRRDIAKECIYGVDINGMAVELAKLSMWLETLATDQPLAFLDHHLKTGNSLVGSDVTQVLSEDDEGDDGQLTLTQAFGRVRRDTLDHVMDLMADLLAMDNETLEDIHSMEDLYAEIQDDPLYRRLFELTNVHTAEQFGVDVPDDAYEQMADAIENESEWSEIQGEDWFADTQELASEQSFFHWELEYPGVFFDEDGEERADAGFDAVIGNPPWGHPGGNKNYLKEEFSSVVKRLPDTFAYFIARSLGVSKLSGYHGMIVPNVVLFQSEYEDLREKLLNNGITQVIDLGEDVFPNVVAPSCIYICNRNSGRKKLDIYNLRNNEQDLIGSSVEPVEYSKQDIIDDMYNVIPTYNIRIRKVLSRIREEQREFEEILNIESGVQTGGDKKFTVSKSDIETHGLEEEYIKPVLFGSDVRPYFVESTEEYLIYTTRDTSKENIQNIIDYLSRYRSDLKSVSEVEQGIRPWFSLHRPRYPELFEQEKIVLRQTADTLIAARESNRRYCVHSLHCITPKKDLGEEISLDTFTCLLNSSLLRAFYDSITQERGRVFSEVKPQNIKQLPVPTNKTSTIPHDKKSDYIQDVDIDSENLSQFSENVDNSGELDILQSARNHLTQSLYSLNLQILDHFGSYADGPTLADVGLTQPPEGAADSILTQTTEERPNLRVGEATVVRESPTAVEIRLTARYKPDDPDDYETDQWGYTETEPLPALRITELAETEADLVEHFVPVAVDEAGGFADFRETATKTNSPVDRLRTLTLPAVADVQEGLESYVETKQRAEELEAKIERTDDLIDEIVYELYGLTDEEIEIVEEAVGE